MIHYKYAIPKIKRDYNRLFKGQYLSELIAESGYKCANPFCDFRDLPLEAHHLIMHSCGGLTTPNNGIILCKNCHVIVHHGCLPLEFLIEAKIALKKNREIFYNDMEHLYADELLNRINLIVESKIDHSEKLKELNRIILGANYRKNVISKYKIFIEALLGKADILSDRITEISGDLQKSQTALEFRRARVCLLGEWVSYFAGKINAHSDYIRGLHFRATSYNARLRHNYAIREYRRIISYIESQSELKINLLHHQSTLGRIYRELAVTRLKEAKSMLAKWEVLKGLQLSIDERDSYDAKVRCAETFVILEEFKSAELYLRDLFDSWDNLDDILKAITLKNEARLYQKLGKETMAKDIIEKGLQFCRDNKIFHEEFQFWRMLQIGKPI